MQGAEHAEKRMSKDQTEPHLQTDRLVRNNVISMLQEAMFTSKEINICNVTCQNQSFVTEMRRGVTILFRKNVTFAFI